MGQACCSDANKNTDDNTQKENATLADAEVKDNLGDQGALIEGQGTKAELLDAKDPRVDELDKKIEE